MNGQKTTKAYGQEAAVLEAFDGKNRKAVDAYTKAESQRHHCGAVGEPASTTCLWPWSAYLAPCCTCLEGFSWGICPAFVQYSRKFSGPINEVANIVGELQSAFAAAERVFGLIDAEPGACRRTGGPGAGPGAGSGDSGWGDLWLRSGGSR